MATVITIFNMNLKITNLRLQQHLPGDFDLTWSDSVPMHLQLDI